MDDPSSRRHSTASTTGRRRRRGLSRPSRRLVAASPARGVQRTRRRTARRPRASPPAATGPSSSTSTRTPRRRRDRPSTTRTTTGLSARSTARTRRRSPWTRRITSRASARARDDRGPRSRRALLLPAARAPSARQRVWSRCGTSSVGHDERRDATASVHFRPREIRCLARGDRRSPSAPRRSPTRSGTRARSSPRGGTISSSPTPRAGPPRSRRGTRGARADGRSRHTTLESIDRVSNRSHPSPRLLRVSPPIAHRPSLILPNSVVRVVAGCSRTRRARRGRRRRTPRAREPRTRARPRMKTSRDSFAR